MPFDSADEVIEGLYLGGIRDVHERYPRVLSLTSTPEQNHCAPGKHLQIIVDDDESSNILEHFESALGFIDDAQSSSEAVLVHCMAGVSRSSTIVTAYLARKFGVSSDAALKMVRQRHTVANPNRFFQDQLRLFVIMGYRIDEGNMEYRRFKLAAATRSREPGGSMHALPRPAAPTEEEVAGQAQVRCRKCRSLLARGTNILEEPPTPANGKPNFMWHQRGLERYDAGSKQLHTGCLFLEPMQWMHGLEATAGKLYCPSCNAKLGSWDWAGVPLASGAWMTPGFALQRTKLDVILKPVSLPQNTHKHL